MNDTQVIGFFSELADICKEASAGLHAAEVAGLGTLAIPSIKTLRSKDATPKEKSHAKFETAGLGILAAHPAYSLAKAGLSKIKKAGILKTRPPMPAATMAKMRAALSPAVRPEKVLGAAKPPGLGSQSIKAPLGHNSMVSGGKMTGWVHPHQATGMDRIRAAAQQDLTPMNAKVVKPNVPAHLLRRGNT